MQVQRQSTGQRLQLDPTSTVGAGGEARIYTIPQDPTLVAKVYHRPAPTHARKLAAMVTNAPDAPMAVHGHIFIAWPLDLLLTTDGQRRVVGFLMRRVSGMRSIMEYYNPRTRRQRCPLFSYRYLHRTGHNLAAAVRALHARGYVIGDVNASNILVTDTALVTLVDTDSFQVREPQNGVIYRCPVGRPEFTAPEVQGRNFADLDRTPEHDLFGLAVLIFQLLMEGTRPFAGLFQGHGDPPPYEARIASGHFPYSRHHRGPYRPMPSAPSFDLLHPALKALFTACFEDGHGNPYARPEAHAWQKALREAEHTLMSCTANDQHLYSNHCLTCPWCERTERLGGRDPFPSRQAVQRRHHLQAASPTPPPLPSAQTPMATLSSSPQRPSVPPTRAMPTVRPPHPTPTAPLSPPRPSRRWAVLTGAFWGAISGALVRVLVQVVLSPALVSQAVPAVLWALVWGTRWSAVWGAVRGAVWGACRRPAAPVASGGPAPLGRIFTGVIWGGMLGIGASILVGMTPVGIRDTPEGAVLEVLLNIDWSATLPALRQTLLASLTGMQEHVIPGAIVGVLLGFVWGACRR
jgi:hypothetical protein